jgi:RimJ/RimL family protein N-acetyltransferase
MSSFDRVVLIGPHVRLDPLTTEDIEPLLAVATESRAGFNYAQVPDSRLVMRAYVERALAEEARGESLPFVARSAGGEVIGSTRFMSIDWWTWPGPPPEPLSVGPDALEIGATWYAARVQRTAVNTEAQLLLCTHAFEAMRVRRVCWKTDVRNARACAALLRIGASFDGVLRAQRPGVDGAIMDLAAYSMLQAEWPPVKRWMQARLAKG